MYRQARQGLSLQRVGLDHLKIWQRRQQLAGLGGGDGIGEQRHTQALREKGDALLGQVGIQDHGIHGVKHVHTVGEGFGGHAQADVHVVYGQLHVAVDIGNEQVGGAGRTRKGEAHSRVHTRPGAVHAHDIGKGIRAQRSHQVGFDAQPRQVAGDVAPHASGGQDHTPGVGIL